MDRAAVQELAQQLEDEGVVLVFAAGNSGGSDDEPSIVRSPQGTEAVLTVAATCLPRTTIEYDGCGPGIEGITDYSSRGVAPGADDAHLNTIDVAAPGHYVIMPRTYGSASGSQAPELGDGPMFGDTPQEQLANQPHYVPLTGTSSAAPHVTGAVALLVQVDPSLTTEEVRSILAATARPFADTSFQAQGHGLIDVAEALKAAAARARCTPMVRVGVDVPLPPSVCSGRRG